MNKKIIKVIGYIFIICFMIIGGVILFHSDFAEPLKHLLGLGSCLAAMVLCQDLEQIKMGDFSY